MELSEQVQAFNPNQELGGHAIGWSRHTEGTASTAPDQALSDSVHHKDGTEPLAFSTLAPAATSSKPSPP